MKTIIIAVGIVIAMGVIVNNLDDMRSFFDNSIEVTKIDEEVIEEVPAQKVDIIDEAKAELERINLELDEEETRLLDEKSKNQTEFDEKQLELETKLEQIRETRTSFQ